MTQNKTMPNSVEEAINQLFPEIKNKFNSWLLKHLTLKTDFYPPIQTPGGFKNGIPEPLYFWDKMLKAVFGKELEQLDCRTDVLLLLFEKRNFEIRNNQELIQLIRKILHSSRIDQNKIKLPNKKKIVDALVHSLSQDKDILSVEIPLFGLKLKKAIYFKNGSLKPLPWKSRVQILKESETALYRYVTP